MSGPRTRLVWRLGLRIWGPGVLARSWSFPRTKAGARALVRAVTDHAQPGDTVEVRAMLVEEWGTR